mgnify:FL=1|jgi:hypothetical protein|tara:strand:- start:212 stop:457 length:246 start_codon:yes stop_codon:yes gene_type:complete
MTTLWVTSSIRTKYYGASDTKGECIIASHDKRRLIHTWDYNCDQMGNHFNAAQAWVDKYIPGYIVEPPGLTFGNEFYWRWQ